MEKTGDNRTEKRRLGDIGENIGCEYLVNRGFEIKGRNYLRKWGELDIIAKKGGIWHFVEVKSVSHVTSYRPEENVHPQKLKRLYRTIQTYLLENRVDEDFQLDVMTVRINTETRQAKVEVIENIVG